MSKLVLNYISETPAKGCIKFGLPLKAFQTLFKTFKNFPKTIRKLIQHDQKLPKRKKRKRGKEKIKGERKKKKEKSEK